MTQKAKTPKWAIILLTLALVILIPAFLLVPAVNIFQNATTVYYALVGLGLVLLIEAGDVLRNAELNRKLDELLQRKGDSEGKAEDKGRPHS